MTNRTTDENFEEILVKIHLRNLHIIVYTEAEHKYVKHYSIFLRLFLPYINWFSTSKWTSINIW
jgi:hypothetical protein